MQEDSNYSHEFQSTAWQRTILLASHPGLLASSPFPKYPSSSTLSDADSYPFGPQHWLLTQALQSRGRWWGSTWKHAGRCRMHSLCALSDFLGEGGFAIPHSLQVHLSFRILNALPGFTVSSHWRGVPRFSPIKVHTKYKICKWMSANCCHTHCEYLITCILPGLHRLVGEEQCHLCMLLCMSTKPGLSTRQWGLGMKRSNYQTILVSYVSLKINTSINPTAFGPVLSSLGGSWWENPASEGRDCRHSGLLTLHFQVCRSQSFSFGSGI